MGRAPWREVTALFLRLTRHLLAAGLFLLGAQLLAIPAAQAQGITTVAIRGTVRLTDGSDPTGTRIVVRNLASGFVVETEVRRDQFLVQGLEAGGPYTIMVRRIGAQARRWDGVFLTLGEPLDLAVVLEPLAVTLDSVMAVSAPLPSMARSHGGTATTLGDSLMHRLPSLNRDVYDFLRLVPQLSSRIGFASGGISGGGAGFRANHFLTNGVPERSLSGAQPPEFAGSRSLPFDAVREYQVLLAPFDARYGDFTGAMVNTVTRSGGNRPEASVFLQGRSDAQARGGALPYERWQFGATFAGPVVRDRLHLLVAGELQRVASPMAGPFLGQPAGATPALPVRASDLDRLTQLFDARGLVAGSGGAVANRGRIGNLFVRLDGGLPAWNSRAVVWLNESGSRSRSFARTETPGTFPLSSAGTDQSFGSRTLALQLHTTLRRPGGGHNEFSLSHRGAFFEPDPRVTQPIVRVAVPATTGGITTVVTGTPVQAQGGVSTNRSLSVRDDLTLPLGASHVATIGIAAEWFRIGPTTPMGRFGTWSFASLDSLELGQPERYEVVRDFTGGGAALAGSQFALHAGDRWQVADQLALTLGLRADLLAISDWAPANPAVEQAFGRRTDLGPRRRIALSPRLGVTWDPPGGADDQLRGGIGVFAGRPPLAWLHVPRQAYGVGVGTLRCGVLPGDLGMPPVFDPDPRTPPVACADGEGLATPPPGDVDLVGRDFGFSRSLRMVLGYERRLSRTVVGTVEALFTRTLADFHFANLNLAGPQGTDPRGRVLYGTMDGQGRGQPVLVAPALPGVIELQVVSRGHAVQLAASVARQFAGGHALQASYTWSEVRDVGTPLRVNNRGVVNWALRAVSGRHDDLRPGVSLNDVPHRVVVAGTWRALWPRWSTEVSLLYVGESGSPFTWRTGGAGGRGDLNADGGQNDPVYVPRNAHAPEEILFSGLSTDPGADNSPAAQQARVTAQREAFDAFIESSPCLQRQRGQILGRNACREPWAASTVMSVRQAVPIGGRGIELQLDLYNLLNLLDRAWGLRRIANPILLEHVGQTPGPSGQPEPVFRFVESSVRWRVEPVESAFQFQLGARYRF